MDAIKVAEIEHSFQVVLLEIWRKEMVGLTLCQLSLCVSYSTIMIRFWIVSKLIMKQTILFGF